MSTVQLRGRLCLQCAVRGLWLASILKWDTSNLWNVGRYRSILRHRFGTLPYGEVNAWELSFALEKASWCFMRGAVPCTRRRRRSTVYMDCERIAEEEPLLRAGFWLPLSTMRERSRACARPRCSWNISGVLSSQHQSSHSVHWITQRRTREGWI